MKLLSKIRCSLRMSCALLSLGLIALPAGAHHSTALYDMTKQTTYEGTVKKYAWQSPHVWIWVEVSKRDGTSETVGIECAAPRALQGRGLDYDSLKKGDKITVIVSPFRDGRTGGLLNSLKFQDGRVMNVGFPGQLGGKAPNEKPAGGASR